MAVSKSQNSAPYSWAGGVRLNKGKALEFGKAFERVKDRVGTSFEAKDLVDEARPKKSPIHGMFEWDDTIAGERYREEQARGYIRALIVIVGPKDDRRPVPAAFSEGAGHGYIDSETALSSSYMRALMVGRALAQSKACLKQYKSIRELAAVFAALDEAEAVFAKRAEKEQGSSKHQARQSQAR